MTTERAPRRLTREARYQQLVELAMPIVAKQGFGDFSLEEIARRADVTRNNLYRYFPRGRPDIVIAVVRGAERELVTDWVTDPELSVEERWRVNTAHIAEHAWGPSDAWRIHLRARAADQPEIKRILADYLGVIVANVSLNNIGTPDPPPRVRVTIEAIIAFSETLLDRSRGTGISQEEIVQTIVRTLRTALAAIQRDA
jgi:AcrR family transcriptional regulator